MIGAPIGLGLGIPLVPSTAAIQSGAFASTGAATVFPVARPIAAAGYMIASDAAADMRGQARAETIFVLESYAAVAGIGGTTSETTVTMAGIATPVFAGAFTVPPTRDAVALINTGSGCLSVAGGRATVSANGGTACHETRAGRGGQSVSGRSATATIEP